MEQLNLLISLHNLSGKQDENFFTEILVFLLRYFIEYENHAAMLLINRISGGQLVLTSKDLFGLDIRTRVGTKE